MITITGIKKGSAAAKNGIKPGDCIKELNGSPVNDMLDFHIYASYLPLEIVVMRDSRCFTVNISTVPEIMNLGIEVEDLKIRHCGNRCVFCFVDQNPKGLRKSLYVKDEDYRYSYLYGSFCTLSKISAKDLVRIVSQKLSPLYISVHAVRKKVRLGLLGLSRDDNFMEKLRFLAEHGIKVHTQIVLVPGRNDGRVLEETIKSLYRLHPEVLSVAVVPLGKTKHRKGLEMLPSVTGDDSERVIDLIESLQVKYFEESGTRFVFAADEFYLKCARKIPSNKNYEGYQQYENGVGLIRYYLNQLKKNLPLLPRKITHEKVFLIVTGKSFLQIVKKHVLKKLNGIENLTAYAIAAENDLLGPEVTVSGLLCGRDIVSAVKSSNIKADYIVIPETSCNYDGVTLDDMKTSDIAKALGAKVITSEKLFPVIGKLGR